MNPVIYETKGRAREYFQLAVNLFSGCGHACKYCYGADVTHQKWGDFANHPKPRSRMLERLEADARRLEGHEDRPILMCFVTDPYQPIERKTFLTREAITILKRHGLRVAILSKGGLRATRDLGLLGPRDWFGATLSLLNATECREYEPFAASPQERIAALIQAKTRGVKTWVSCEPVIDPKQTLRLIMETAPYVDVYKVGKMNYNPALEKEIDWRRFALSAIDLLDRTGKRYYIKKDLAAFLGKPGGIDGGRCS